MSNSKRVNTVTALAALGAVAITGAAAGILSSKKLSAATPISAPPNATLDRNLPASFSAIIDRVGPAVVSIRVTGKVPRAGAPLSEIPEPFKRFFGDKFGFGFGNPGEGSPQRGSKVQGTGSGFFIDAKGHVVTNNHVVADAEKIEIMLKDGDTYEATLVGRDPKTDLALLKVTSDRKFSFVRFGRSSDAKVGDWVIALGSPFGLGQTATTGIVSARGRDIGAGPYDDFLQIDAPINKGNSGGPTFNTRGEVIGINTAIISPTGVSAGIGFAVPSDMAKSVIAQLKDKGAVARGWLGVNIQRVTKDLAAGLGMKTPEGALVSNVTEDSPAAKAGLKAGDVIVAVEDERIEKMRELPRRVARLATDQTANFTIVRNGRERIIDVVIGKMPGVKKKAAATTDKSTKPRFGLTLAAIDEQTRIRFSVGKNIEGVVVTAVEPGSIAAEKGIRPGDVVRRIGSQEISDPAEVSRLLATAVEQSRDNKRNAVLVLVNRKGNDRYIALPRRDA